ncbi:MAG: ABC transporter ATP-binding protein, partial [Parasporobacterium sp.]|nr:ABC transporter ATP-binding protein [Parasporobacterium sp.]
MLRLLKYLGKREWIYAALTFVFTFVSVWLALTIPDYMSNITTLVQTGGAMEDILKAGGIMLLCCVGDAVCTIIVGYLSAVIGSSFGARLRGVIYRKITSFSMEEISQFSTSSLVIRSTNDVMQVLNVITMGLSSLLRAPMIAIWSIVKIVGKGRQEWLLVTIIAVCVAAVIIISNMVLVVPKFRIIQRLTDNLNRVARENLTGVRVVRAYNAEKYQEDKFGEANNVITKTHLFTGKVMAYMSPGMQFVMSCTSLAIYWVGAYIINNTPAIADRIGLFSNMVVFMQYAIQVIMAFMMLSFIFIMIPRAQVSGERIREVL